MNGTRYLMEETTKQSKGTVRELTLAEMDAVAGAAAVLPTYPGQGPQNQGPTGQVPGHTLPPK